MFLFIRMCLGITFNKYPLEVIQNQNEQKPINLYNLVGGLENSSFKIINTSSQIQANLTNTLEKLEDIQLDATFCPISEWQPRAQLAHFYLSLNNILMLSGKDQVYMQLNNKCFSIFQYNSVSFGVDCISSDKVDFIQIFNLTLDGVVITGFSPFSTIPYISPYQNCLQRITQQFIILEEEQLNYQFIQYCSIEGNGQFTIFDEYFQVFNIYSNSDLSECNKIQNIPQIDKVFTNQQSSHRSSDTWNLGFTFEKKSGVCKCLYQRKTFTCDYIFLQMFTPSYFRALHSINDNTYIIVGNEKQVYILVLSSSIQEKDSQTVLYKDIYDKYSNQLIDSTLTSEYILFTVARAETRLPAQQFLQLKCLGQDVKQNFFNSNVKIYSIQQLSEEIYQSVQLPINSLLLSNYENFGVKNQYIQYDHQQQLMTIIQINPKLLTIQFTGDLQIDYQQEMVNLTVNYNQHFENDSKQSTNITLLICVNNQTDKTPYLIAQTWSESDNVSQHHVCPFPNDNKTYVKLVNELNLLDGLMGPLLEFNYVPDPVLPMFFPFYIQYNITAQVMVEIFDNIDIIYNAVRVNDVIQFDVYNTIILSVSNYKRQSVDVLLCNIIESQSYLISNPVNLTIQECETIQKFDGPKDVIIDFFENFVGFQVYGSIRNNSIYVCNKIKCGQLDLNETMFKIYNIPTQQTGTVLTFTIMIQSSEYELKFYQYTFNPLFINDTIHCILSNTIDSRNFFNNSIIIDYKFLYHFEEMLIILLDNYEILIFTQGQIYPMEGYFINFTRISAQFSCSYCQNSFEVGGIEVLDSHIISQVKQLIVWCTKIDKSHLVQYSLFNPYQVAFYRELPLYMQIIDPALKLFQTSSQLFVGIYSKDVRYRVYYIYDPFDFSPRTLVTQFQFEARDIGNIVYPIYAPVKLYNERRQVSMALVISKETFIYFLNPQAKFYSRYKTMINQTSLQQEQILLIRIQQFGEAFVKYRQYNLYYELNYTLIEPTGSSAKLNITPSKQEGFQFQLIVQSNQLNGTISNYGLLPKSNKSQVQIQEYVSLNKRIGEYLTSIDIYGEVIDLIDLDNYQYYTLYQADNVEQYANLLVVLTRKSLLFLEKTSYKSSNIFDNCNAESTWQKNNSLCNARIINPLWNDNRFLSQEFIHCHATPNQIYELILICQNKKSQFHTAMMYFYVNFTYYQDNSTVVINKFQNVTNSYLQDLFSDKSLPLMINGIVYQILVHTLYFTNSEVGMFQLEFTGDSIELVNSQFITNASENGTPYQLIEDFDAAYYFTNKRTFILLLLLQETNLVMTFIDQDLQQYVGYVYYGAELVDNYSFLGDLLNYNYIQILSPNGTYPNLELALGNKTHILILNLTLNDVLKISSLQLLYTFIQYYECADSLIIQGFKRPQFVFNKYKQIEYLIAPCIKKLSNYYGNYEEFIELYGLPSQNQIFLQFFQKQQNQNMSTPIQILQTQTIDILKSNPILFQTYQSYYQPHIIISSSIYLLDDYQIRNQTIFQIYTNSTEDEIFYFYANNSEFHFQQKLVSKYQKEDEPDKDVLAFIILIIILILCFILIVGCVVYHYLKNKQRKNAKKKHNDKDKTGSQLLINSGGSLEIPEMDKMKQRSESVFILDDAVRQVFAQSQTSKKKKRQSNV
ncbi:hypothetical protein pb186bvf_004092 [Paramecium bursaria]